jgi:hypothetical protein
MEATKEVDFNKYGIKSGHIEYIENNGISFQRHVWLYEDGSIEKEQWIVNPIPRHK